jgi:hypothetical protein
MEFPGYYGWHGKTVSGKNPRVEMRKNLTGKVTGFKYPVSCEALITIYPDNNQPGKVVSTLSMNSTAVISSNTLMEMAEVIRDATDKLATVIQR